MLQFLESVADESTCGVVVSVCVYVVCVRGDGGTCAAVMLTGEFECKHTVEASEM